MLTLFKLIFLLLKGQYSDDAYAAMIDLVNLILLLLNAMKC